VERWGFNPKYISTVCWDLRYHYIRALFKKPASFFLVVLNVTRRRQYYLNDLEQMIGEQDVLFYPGSYRPYQIEDCTDNANVLLRAGCSTE
jgi:transcription-repair coupling factor (superfamily II helicase)